MADEWDEQSSETTSVSNFLNHNCYSCGLCLNVLPSCTPRGLVKVPRIKEASVLVEAVEEAVLGNVSLSWLASYTLSHLY